MRRCGTLEASSGLGLGDHVCWAYEDDDELARVVGAWVRDGIEAGERVVYATDRPAEQVRRDLAAVDDIEALIDDRRLELNETRPFYQVGPVDEVLLLSMYATATAEALADGCTGLRVVAAISELPTGREVIDALVSWEQAADAFVHRAPMAALCACDRRTVSDAAIAAIAAAHPLLHGVDDLTPFVLHPFEDGLRLAGDVETFDRFRLDTMLRNALGEKESTVSVYLHDLHHASAGCVNALHSFARRVKERGGSTVFRGASSAFASAWVALGFTDDAASFA